MYFEKLLQEFTGTLIPSAFNVLYANCYAWLPTTHRVADIGCRQWGRPTMLGLLLSCLLGTSKPPARSACRVMRYKNTASWTVVQGSSSSTAAFFSVVVVVRYGYVLLV